MSKKVGHKPKGSLPVNKMPTGLRPAPEAVAYKPSKQELDRERRYKAEDALSSIERAEKCKQDKELMQDVRQLAQEKISSLKNIK